MKQSKNGIHKFNYIRQKRDTNYMVDFVVFFYGYNLRLQIFNKFQSK